VYDYWVPQVGTSNSSIAFTTQETVASSIIVNAGYLVRYAWLQGSELHLSADFNATTTVEVIGVPTAATSLYVNGVLYSHTKTSNGFWAASVKYSTPKLSLPDFSKLTWKYVDSLPELQSTYDDSAWVSADHDWTNNTANPLATAVSLYASDYGFNTGNLLYRGHFVANGNEKSFYVETIGGSGFGSSVWLNGTLLGSWTGSADNASAASTYTLPTLKAGSSYTLTILTANTGLEEDWTVGTETMKTPRGILDFDLSGHSQSDISWKITGNLGGEDYFDLTRGPLNEGGLYAERQGWHQPSPPSSDWETSSPLDGVSQAGVGFYSTSFTLDFPQGYDIPLYFAFGDSSGNSYRAQLYVNGYQYGTYVPQLGPQTEFPVPQGILNYRGENWVAITLWAQESSGAKVGSFELTYTTPVLTALTGIESSPQPAYSQRSGAY
jgi:beta-galactosidase